VHDEHGQIDLLQVVREVGFREGLDAVVLRLCTALHSSLAAPISTALATRPRLARAT
jgi:hypothetical protein